MEKFILEKRANIKMEIFLEIVRDILENKAINKYSSNYSHCAMYKIGGIEYDVWTVRNEKSIKFILTEEINY